LYLSITKVEALNNSKENNLDIHWILKALTAVVWIYFLYILSAYLFSSFKIHYVPDNPEKGKSRLPIIAFLTGLAIFATYFLQPDLFNGYLSYIILIISPLIIWDGLLPLIRKKNVVFGGNLIFKEESFIKCISSKKVSRIDRKNDSIIFKELESMVPILIFHKRDYSDEAWNKLNAFLVKKFPKKMLDFTIKK